jgi:hypothetical protein
VGLSSAEGLVDWQRLLAAPCPLALCGPVRPLLVCGWDEEALWPLRCPLDMSVGWACGRARGRDALREGPSGEGVEWEERGPEWADGRLEREWDGRASGFDGALGFQDDSGTTIGGPEST